jgi:phospholipase C
VKRTVITYTVSGAVVLMSLVFVVLVSQHTTGAQTVPTTTSTAPTPTAITAVAAETSTEERDLSPTATPIKHFITLMQENHSFDNYFGTYPGADGIPPGTCIPRDPDLPDSGCVEPFPIGERAIVDLGHNLTTFEEQYNDGAMDGFLKTFEDQAETGDLSVGYYDDNDLPYYWTIADEYVLFDRFFTSAKGGSVPNHFYWVTGTPGNPENGTLLPGGFDHVPTIFDSLEAAGVSWKFYVQNYDPSITFRNPEAGDRGSQIVWVPILNYNRFLDDPTLFNKIVPFEEFYTDLENGTLPEVAYMVPSGASEHPPGSIQAGERFVRSIITALKRSSAWESSAFTWTYDDWGGWYDHVAPPQVDDWGYGFRAPALLVSPYAKQGYVDNTELDFTSVLKFIEENWGLDPLAVRDEQANSLDNAFDFDSPPREPILLSRDRDVEEVVIPNTRIVYVAYGIGFVIPLVFGLLAVVLTWWSKKKNRGEGS